MAGINLVRACILLFCIHVFIKHSVVAVYSPEDLWNFLFENGTYNKHLRPLKNWSQPLEVDLQMSVIAIVDFNEVKEQIKLTTILKLSWKDEFLTWEPEEFGNLSHLRIPQHLIWKPYLNIENSIEKLGEFGTPSLHALLESSGKVTWKPVEVFTVSCSANVYKFPFDTQICHIEFEPSGYSPSEVTLTSSAYQIDLHEYEGTSGWDIVNSTIEIKERPPDMYLICSLILERKPLYFILNIFLPILLLSILNMFVFILPVESGEKISFVVTVFLSLAVFLTIVSGKLPENSEKISLLNIYVFANTFVSTLVAVLTIIQIRIHHRSSHIPVPSWLKRFTEIFTLERGGRDLELETEEQEKSNSKEGLNDNEGMNVHKTVSVNITWPDVVKAFDNAFFIFFVSGYIIVTIALLGLAMQK